jgi:acetyl-CoA carboxylase biotin carboxylase subunit
VITSVLIANRGEIARRIIRTTKTLGIRSIAVYSDIDADLPFAREADESVRLPGEGATAYRDIDAILKIAADTGAEAIHPGYGFLSENAGFAQAVTSAGLIWVGPSSEVIATMGDKIAAREAAIAAGVPVVPGSAALSSAPEAVAEADASVTR